MTSSGPAAGGMPPASGASGATGTALDALLAEVRAAPERIAVLFPAVARTAGRGPTDPADPGGLRTPRVEDRARAVLLVAAARAGRWPAARLAEEVTALYRYGDADEKRAVLRALDPLDDPDTMDGGAEPLGDAGLPLVTDALRTNDPRLVAAALGPYAARRLPPPAWRQAVLKCLFTGVPLDAVAGWTDRADGELARMTADYAAEREAAGRPVPPDARRILALFPDLP
ncbi:EboA domain-containing protein [Streptomyces sp. YIM 98790]|uniref:EboA domain-containing protein n=1 Tax=Streptomyces sp. YIM 98790 TaxID=2689077 RepID=UPI001FB637AE|nr:EboA domain-containing protein [Streptomyces sp. YIM 98790]